MADVPIIRCMGLNYRDHAAEANMPIPKEPVLFIKPRTALNGPHPARINVPAVAQDGTSDYEAELSFVLGKSGRDIPEDKAMEYVLGYTASNDVSARAAQFANSQWSFSKGVSARTRCRVGKVMLTCRLRRRVSDWAGVGFADGVEGSAQSTDQGDLQRQCGARLEYKVGK